MNEQPERVAPDCGPSCRFRKEWSETMDPAVPGSRQDFAECDPPIPEGVSDDDAWKAIEKAFESGEPCPYWAAALVTGKCAGRCGTEFVERPVTELFAASGMFDAVFACSPACYARADRDTSHEIRALHADDLDEYHPDFRYLAPVETRAELPASPDDHDALFVKAEDDVLVFAEGVGWETLKAHVERELVTS